MRILVLCDDRWHPAQTVRKGLSPLEGKDVVIDFYSDAKEWSVEGMERYPLVIVSKSNNCSSNDETPWMTQAVEDAFIHYVEQGSGLLVIHSGTAEYQETSTFKKLLGGVFTHHPEPCPVTVEPTGRHPLVEGLESFTVTDEHYFMEMVDDNKEIILNTSSLHGTQPGAWIKTLGKGRVGVLTPGHTADVWLHPGFQKILKKLMNWCSGGAV